MNKPSHLIGGNIFLIFSHKILTIAPYLSVYSFYFTVNYTGAKIYLNRKHIDKLLNGMKNTKGG